jgi:hypothetical protein
VTSDPPGIACGASCQHDFLAGLAVSLSAVPAAGSAFGGWSGACAGGSVTMAGPTTCDITWGHAFEDDPLVPGVTQVKVVHIQELRNRIGALRSRFGLQPFSWRDGTLVAGATLIRREHIQDLRTALSGAYVSAGRTQPTYTDPSLASGMLVKAVHITELRGAVKAIE